MTRLQWNRKNADKRRSPFTSIEIARDLTDWNSNKTKKSPRQIDTKEKVDGLPIMTSSQNQVLSDEK